MSRADDDMDEHAISFGPFRLLATQRLLLEGEKRADSDEVARVFRHDVAAARGTRAWCRVRLQLCSASKAVAKARSPPWSLPLETAGCCWCSTIVSLSLTRRPAWRRQLLAERQASASWRP